MKRRRYYPIVLGLAAGIAVVSAGIGTTWSYFTTYAETRGGFPIRMGDRTEITESFSDWTKHISITNTDNSEPVYVRAKAFCGSQYTITHSGDGWVLGGDGYYYYQYPVNGGAAAGTLDLKIEGIPDDPESKKDFNVVVIYESTAVKYHEDGTPYSVQETDWNEILDTGSTEVTGGAREADAGDTGSVGDTEENGESDNADSGNTEGGGEG